jgi:hypothetical protein
MEEKVCSHCHGNGFVKYRRSDGIYMDMECPMCHGHKEQPAPVKNKETPAAWDLVMDDIKKRDDFGKAKYGVRLQPNNGRDTLRDVYEEMMDAIVYMRSLMYERDGR